MPLIAIAAVVAIALVLAVVAAFFGFHYMMKGKEASDLRRYLQRDGCQWESMTPPGAGGGIYYKNGEPEASGIEMRVYRIDQPAEAEDEGVCLSIIDPANGNGMILNGFPVALEAMEFGDGLWHDRFLGDAGIMEGPSPKNAPSGTRPSGT